MYVQLLFLLGLAYAVTARDCLLPTDMDSFDMKKFEGVWYELAFTTGNKSEETEYDESRCLKQAYKENGQYFGVEVDYLEDGEDTKEIGKFERVADKNSFFNIISEDPDENVYLYKIICTDYSTYAVYYYAAQYDAGHCSEFTVLVGRDRSAYDALIANDEVKKCLQDKLQTPVDILKQISQSDCK